MYCMNDFKDEWRETHSSLNEFVGVSSGADRDRDSARGQARGRSTGLSEGLLTDPVGRGGVELDEASAGHGSRSQNDDESG